MCPVCNGEPGCPCCTPEPKMKECPECNGKGVHYYAYDMDSGDTYECTQEEYDTLPDEESMAELAGTRRCKAESEICRECDGCGEVEDLYEPDWDSMPGGHDYY